MDGDCGCGVPATLFHQLWECPRSYWSLQHYGFDDEILRFGKKALKVDDSSHLSHFMIYKNDTDGYTKTKISRLNDNERIVEIAKMLEGNNASESAYTHAKQLLN